MHNPASDVEEEIDEFMVMFNGQNLQAGFVSGWRQECKNLEIVSKKPLFDYMA